MIIKKFLILMFALVFASSVSALVTLDPSGNQPVGAGSYDVYVVSDEDVTGYELYLALTDKTYGSIPLVTALPKAGDDGSAWRIPDMAGFFDIWVLEALDMSEPFDSIVAGRQFRADVTYTGAAVGEDLTMVLLDGSLNVLDSVTFQIPEPMTIALLALGGLFLLRRRK